MPKLRYAAVVGMMALLFVPAVFADFPEFWEEYPSGTASPGPWTLATTMAACWTGTQVMTLSPGSAALSPPNVYDFTGASTAGCFTTSHNANLSTFTNATAVSVTLSFYYNDFTPAASNSTSYTFSVYLCGTLAGAISVAHTTSYWKYASFTETSTPGHRCTVSLFLATVGSGSAVVLNVGIDNLYIKNANIITPGANFFLMNAQTGSWFSIGNYTNSYIIVQFPSGPPVYYYNVTIPDLVISTIGASLVTVWVGQSYFVHIIPAQSGNNYVYLNPPNSPVLPYTVAIQDLSGVFTPGTQITIYQGNRVMWSDYTDGQNNVPVWMVPGAYKVILMNGANQFSTTSNFPSLSGAVVAIQILSQTYKNQCGQTCTVSYAAGFDPTLSRVIVVFNDTSLGTSHITDALYIRNTSGTFLLYSASWSGTYGSFQDSISCATKTCNSANVSMMYVNFNYYGMSGSDSVNLPLNGGSLFAQSLNIPLNLLGLDVLFPSGTVSYQSIFSYFIILITASAFGVFSARFGVVVTAILAAALALEGWLPIAPGAITFIVAMAVMSFIASLERS